MKNENKPKRGIKSAVSNQEQKPDPLKKEDSNVAHEDVKLRVTFLAGQSFRGVYRQKGEYLDLPENDAKAYSKRTGLKIEAIK